MKSLYNKTEASKCKSDLELRVYTSRLLGKDSSLVLHGGGNTSVKSTITNLFGKNQEVLYVKGSGWDLATIQKEGFAPIRMSELLKMVKLDNLSDTDMVKYQRMAMTNPFAPNPSVEAILHAIIPFKFVDHTHADAIVTITNTKNGKKRIRDIYGDKVLIIPYIMPGFALAKLVFEMTKGINWNSIEGMVLLNHGLFTFDDDAKKSYEKTIEIVSRAQDYLKNQGANIKLSKKVSKVNPIDLATIRKEVSILKGHPVISILNESNIATTFSQANINKISQQGPLTPDHVIRTKRIPVILNKNYKKELHRYIRKYKKYFNKNSTNEIMLNPTPNFAILKNNGSLSFGANAKEANIIKDINNHTFEAILKAEKLGGYQALSKKEIFDVEYWSLEQAKLKKDNLKPEFSGKIALIIGSSSVKLSIAKILSKKGCAIVVLDNSSKTKKFLDTQSIKYIRCNLSSTKEIKKSLRQCVKYYGGIDIVISNGNDLILYPELLKEAMVFLRLGIDPQLIMIVNKKGKRG